MAGKTNGALKLGSSSPTRGKEEKAGKVVPKAAGTGKPVGVIGIPMEKRESGSANPIITQMGRALGEKLGTLPREEKQNRQQLVGGGNQPSGKSGLQLGQWGADQSAPLTNRALTGGGGTFLGGGGSMGVEETRPRSAVDLDQERGRALTDHYRKQLVNTGNQTPTTSGGNASAFFGKGAEGAKDLFEQKGQPAALGPMSSRTLTGNNESMSLSQWLASGRQSAQPEANRKTISPANGGGGTFLGGGGQRDKGMSTADLKQAAKDLLAKPEQKINNWEGRDELIRELEEIDNNSGWVTDEWTANEVAARRTQIIKALEDGDALHGNGLQSYGDVDRGRQIFSGASKDYASGVVNKLGNEMAMGYEGVDTNPYAGWATDEMSRAAIPFEHEEDQMADYQFLKTGAKKMEEVADQLGESAAKDLESAKAGLSGLGQAGVDIATNVIQMGYDAMLGKVLGGALVPMYLRSSGSGARQARLEGADVMQQHRYGVASGAIEVGTEMLGNGVSSVLSKVYGKGLADDVAEEIIRRVAKSDVGRSFLRFLGSGAGEGTEEVIADLLSPLAQKLYKQDSLGELYRSLDLKEIGYDFLIGAAIGWMGGTVGVAAGANRVQNEILRAEDRVQDKMKTGMSRDQATSEVILEDMLEAATEEETEDVKASPDESTSVDTNPADHTTAEQDVIEEYQAAVDVNLAAYIENIRDNGKDGIKRYDLKPVSDRAADEIRRITGIETKGNATQLEPRIVEHILNRHGENGKQDSSMKDVNDIARMQYVLDNFDDAEDGGYSRAYVTNKPGGKQGPARTVIFSKAVNGTYYVVEAVPDTSRNTVFIASAYMENKKPAVTQSAHAEESAPRVTSETSPTVPTDDITIAQGQEESNTEFTGLQLGAQQEGARNETVQQETAPAQPGLPGQTPAGTGEGESGLRLGAADAIRTGTDAGAQAAVSGDRADLSGGDGRRDAGGRAGGQAGRVVGNAGAGSGPAAEGNGRQAARAILGNALREQGIEKQSSRSFGIERGTDTDLFQVVPEDSYEASWSDLKYKLELSTGYKVHFIIGPMEIMGSDGKPHKINGCCDHTSGRIIIRVDSRLYSPDQIGRHEEFHVLAKRDPELVKEIQNRIVARYGRDEMARIFRGYQEKRRGINDIRSGNQAALAEEFSELCEEIFADAYGRMNAFGLGADSFMGTVAGTIGDRSDRIWNRETRGPPAQERLQNIENEKRDLMDLLSSLQRAGNGYTDPSGNYYTEEDADRIAQHLADLDEQSEKLKQNQGSQKYTYAGESAWNADFAALKVAQEMEQEGADAETIREDTGWFRGMDGRWRFEIDDSEARYSGYGDAAAKRASPGYAEWEELLSKFWSDEGLTVEEEHRLAELDEIWEDEPNRLNKLVSEGKATLDMILDHEDLYRAYPGLRNIHVVFADLGPGTNGEWNPRLFMIRLNKSLRDWDTEARSTLLHEVQHAIQGTEGFARGANPGYWERQLREGYDGRTKAEREASRETWEKYNRIREEDPEFFREAAELMLSKPNSPRGAINWDTLEKLEPDPPEWKSFDARRHALEEKYGEGKVFNFINLFHELKSREATNRSQYDLYRNTAGEIEARDVQSRRDLNREERRNKAPNLGDEDTVFTEEGAIQLSDNETETMHLKDQIIQARDRLAEMEPVADVTAPTSFPKRRSDRVDWAERELEKYGRFIDNPLLGKVDLGSRIDAGMKYARTDADKAAFLAIPAVLEKGVLIGHHAQHKGGKVNKTQDLETWTFGAPVTINGVTGNMGVIVQKTTGLFYKAHKVLMPDGTVFLLNDISEEIDKAESGRVQGAATNGRLVAPTDSADSNTITSKKQNGKQDFSIAEDEDQITMDDLTEGDYSLSATVGPQHERELARILKSHVKDLLVGYQAEGRYDPITEEDIDDWMDADEYHDSMASLFNDSEQVLDELYLLSEDEPWEREEIYYLMERIVRTLNPETAQKYTMENVRRETRPAEEYYSGLKLQSVVDAAGEYGSDYPNFARWYNSRNPSIYYPDYEPGDLFDAGKNIQSSRALNRVNENYDREMEYLRSLIDDPSVSEETRKDAEDFYNRMANPHEQWTVPDANGEDRTYREVFYSADEDSDRRESTGEEELGEARLTEAEKEIAELKKDNDQLKEYAEYWKRQGRITGRGENRARRSDVQRFAKELIEHADYQGDKAELRQKLQDLANMIASNDGGSGLNWESVHEAAEEIAELLVDNSYQMVDPEKDTRENLKNRLKELKIRPDEMWTHDFGDWADFRRKQFGKLVFSREGQSIDDVYKILRSEFGDGLFPETETAGSDQIRQILHALDQLAPERAYNFANDEEADLAASYYTNRVTDELLFGNIREELTQADKNYQKVKERMQRAEEKVRQLRTEKRELQRMQHNEVRAALQEQRKNLHQREETQKVRKSITKTAKRLLKYLDENSGKNPIPEPMKEAVGNLLLSLDISGGMEQHQRERYLESMQEVARIVTRQFDYMNGKDDAWDGMFLDLPPDLKQELDEHLEYVRKAIQGDKNQTDNLFKGIKGERRDRAWNPNMMNLEELKRLDEILTAVSSAIQSANEILSDERGRKIDEAAAPVVRFLNSLGKDKNRKEHAEKLNNLLRFQNATPYYFFKKLGPAGVEMFERIQDGWDRFAFNVKQVINFANETYTAKEVKDLQTKTETFQLRRRGDMSEGFDKPEKVTMTKAQIMSLYCLWKREQAQTHIAGAGIRIADYKDSKGKTVKQAENYLLDPEDITKIVGTLTPREKEIADKLQKYMNTVGSDWGNEVSLRRFGIRSFTEDNYFPIETDDRTRPVRSPERDSTDLYRLLNIGFTKSTVRNASNALVLNNIFDVFSNHMADMAKYNGLGLPLLDTLKWFSYSQILKSEEGQNPGEKKPGQEDDTHYGYESIQKSLERAYGREARNYFTTFIKDLNGVREGGRGIKGWNKFASNYKVAAVGANLRVALLQPTSYTRAGAVLDKKYLIKGLKMNNRQGQKEALQHSGTAVWKDLGFYDTNINAGLREIIKHDDGWKEKVQDAAMKGAEMGDKITWGALWNACKAEQTDKGLKGEALNEATARRFREVVYRTQVMDSTMTRSHVMRQKDDGVMSLLTAFMSEPTVSYNMLLDAYGDYETARRQGMSTKDAWKKSGKVIGKATTAYITTSLLAAIVESAIDAARDDDEYATYLERFFEKFWGENFIDGNLMQDLLIHNKIPIIKNVIDALGGKSTSLMEFEGLAKIAKAAQIWTETIKLQLGLMDKPTKVTYNGNMTTWGKIYNTLQAVSQLSGLPLGNTVRDAVALWNSTAGEAMRGMKIQTYDPGEEKKIQYAVKDGYLTEEEAIDWLLKYELVEDEDEARQKVYVWAHPEKYERLLSAMNAGDMKEFQAAKDELQGLHFKPSSIEAAIKNEVHERYVGREGEEPIDREEAVRLLMEYGGMIQRKADEQVQKWTSEIETGVSFSDIGASYVAGDISRDQAVQMLMDYGGYAQDKAEAKVQQWASEIDTGIGYSEIGDRFFYDEITRDEAVDMYMKYGGKTQEEAEDAVNKIAFRKETGHERERAELQTMYMEGEYSRDQMKDMMLEYGYSKTEESAENSLIRWDFIGTDYEELDAVSPWQAKRYFEMVEDAEIDRKTYLQFAQEAEQLKADYDENGKDIAYSKMNKVFALIDSLDLTPEQKTALALSGWDSSNDGYSQANIDKYAPWEGGSPKSTKKKSGGGGRRGGGGGGRRSGAPAGGLVLGEAADTGHRGIYDQILIGWRKRKYSRAQILAMVRAGILTQEEADEILATTQDEGEADGSLTLGAAEELSA